MASGHDNPNAIADGALFFLRDSSGLRQLFQLESVSITDEGSVSNVNGPGGVIGSVRAAGGFSLSVTSRRSKGVPQEADWEGLRDDDEHIRFEIQYLGSDRHLYDCRVSTVNESINADGAISKDITLTASNRNIIRA